MHFEIVRSGDTARIASDTRLVDIVFSRDVIFPLIVFISHEQLLRLVRFLLQTPKRQTKLL